MFYIIIFYSTKLFLHLYLVKFLDTLIKPFFSPAGINLFANHNLRVIPVHSKYVK